MDDEVLQKLESMLEQPGGFSEELSSAAISSKDVGLANQLRKLHFKRVDVDIIQYLKETHHELYSKLKMAVLTSRAKGN